MALNKFDSLDMVAANLQRPFRYKASLSLPEFLIPIAGALYDNGINILCKKAQIPRLEIQTNNLGVMGRTIKVPSVMNLANSTQLTWYLDEKLTVRRILEYWMFCIDSAASQGEDTPALTGSGVNGIIGSLANAGATLISKVTKNIPIVGKFVNKFLGINGGIGQTNYIDMTGSLTISCINYSGNSIGTYTFNNVFPTNLSEADFDDSNTTSVMEFTADFSYTHFTYKKESSSILEIGADLAGGLIDKGTSALNKLF